MAVLRAEIPVSYKTTINRTIVNSLRDVFTTAYPDSDFQNLKIAGAFPLTEIEYPAIICKYAEGPINNAGVGHVEFFPGPDGAIRKWKHRRFEGTLEFTIAALSPLDRDVLSDAFVEVMSFGDLTELQNNFFLRIYGDLGVNVGVIGLLQQLTLNTDNIMPTGETANIAPWQPEDVMVYLNGYSVECHGGFYNSPPTNVLGPIQDAIIEAVIIDAESEFVDTDPENQWSFVFDYDDAGAVVSQGIPINTPNTFIDSTSIISVGVVSSVEDYVPA